jgi:uncharacterized protein YjcR
MAKVTQTKTPEEFDKITRVEFYRLWFGATWKDTPYTFKQIATMYGVDVATVKAKKKELGLTWLKCGVMFMAGGDKYKDPKQLEEKRRKEIEKTARKNAKSQGKNNKRK